MRRVIVFLMAALALISGRVLAAPQMSAIKINGQVVRPGEVFELEGQPFKLVEIVDDRTLKIEYDDLWTGSDPRDPGMCRPVQGKRYIGLAVKGEIAFRSNTCDSFTGIIFEGFTLENDVLVVKTVSTPPNGYGI